ncbi:hypothetical protein BGZ73_006589 [Actinomortierella ambigua]|nr:hypothetical protein BGZ73_006589 [Actinomortierella ambigua]
MKAFLALAAAVLSAPALVAGVCVNKNYGYGSYPRPCDCPAGYTIFQNSNCDGASVHFNSGGWTTNSNNWPVKSYECDAVSLAGRCVNQSFGVGTFSKPCDCVGGYTIYQNANCGGATVHFDNGGWQTRPGDWPVRAYMCDQVRQTARCINRSYGKGSFTKPGNCPGGYTIYQNGNCGGASVHIASGGWTTGPNNWNVQAYRCDTVQVSANRCTNRHFGVGTFPKPTECATTGYTIYQGDDCTGATVHLSGGWTTRDGDWPVKSFRCDDGCSCTARTAFSFLYEPEYFETTGDNEVYQPEEEDVLGESCGGFNVQ